MDGCVKIYNSRIDSVDLETRKLLNGLLENNANEKTRNDDDDDEKTNGKREEKSSKIKNVETLVDNSAITCVDLEQDFFQDPLFQKTAADFDQGGAQGLLLSNLDISSQGRVIFDGSDVNLDNNHVDEFDGDYVLDLQELKSKFGSKLDLLHSQLICPTFQNFKFSDSNVQDYSVDNRQDFYHEPIDFNSDIECDDNNVGYDDGASFGNDIGFREDFGTIVQTSHGVENEVSVSERMMRIVDSSNIASDANAKYSYFDKGHQWAGPQFWKSRVAPSSRPKQPAATRKKQKLDFSVKLSRKEVFARKVSTVFGKTGGFKKKQELLLPKDYGVKASIFDTLFLKPNFRIEAYSEMVKRPIRTEENDGNEDYSGGWGQDHHDDGMEHVDNGKFEI